MYLIEILHQTTTTPVLQNLAVELYLIEILHQTTTTSSFLIIRLSLYLIEILHQTTTAALFFGALGSCILSKFYIKPQRHRRCFARPSSCILSKFYIKPQPSRNDTQPTKVVSYRNSTSNHNNIEFFDNTIVLYLIEILHQTTTARPPSPRPLRCILSKFYIKPQLWQV